MHIKPDLVVKRISECEPGELVILRLDAALVKAIALESDEKNSSFATLEMSGRLQAIGCHVNLENKTMRCTSYGKNWTLVLSPGPETYPTNLNHRRTGASIHVDDSRRVLTLLPPNTGALDEFYFDLDANAFGDSPGREAAPILNWEIWLKTQDRTAHNTEAWLSVKAKD